MSGARAVLGNPQGTLRIPRDILAAPNTLSTSAANGSTPLPKPATKTLPPPPRSCVATWFASSIRSSLPTTRNEALTRSFGWTAATASENNRRRNNMSDLEK